MLKTFDITYCDETSCFSLQTEHSTYIIGSADGYLGHVCCEIDMADIRRSNKSI